jgi:signal transduction histidine kinase
MQALSRRLVEAQENERRHIARELHDEAGQALTSLRFGLRQLERENGGDGVAAGRVAELVQRTDAVIDGLHRLAADLRPASLDHVGLEAACASTRGCGQASRSISRRTGSGSVCRRMERRSTGVVGSDDQCRTPRPGDQVDVWWASGRRVW